MLRIILSLVIIIFSNSAFSKGTNVFGLGIYDIKFDGSDWRIKDLSLSRAFGDTDASPYVTHLPQIYKYTLDKKDKFIIFGCDGLWDVMSNKKATDYILNLIFY